MSNLKARRPAGTEGGPALQRFTDRHEAIRLFASYLNGPPPSAVLFFHGDGGNGKSLLLRYLVRYCRWRRSPDNWEYVRGKTGDEFEEELMSPEGARLVPFAQLDFGMPPAGDERPREAFAGLAMLRHDLAASAREANYTLHFPLYDFACLWYLQRTGGLTDERRQRLFPPEEMELVGELVNAFGQTSLGSLIRAGLGVLGKQAREWFTFYRQRRGLDEAEVREIMRLEPRSELLDELPRLFAADLGAAMSAPGAPERVLLAFDSHEKFWGHERGLAGALYFQRDEWLRRLLDALELSEGVAVVAAGRDRPRWAEAGRYPVAGEKVEAHLVGHFREADADLYLKRAEVGDAAMRRCLIAQASVGPDQVHPLYLGLCADVLLAAEGSEKPLTPEDFRGARLVAGKENELIERLLLYVDVEIDAAVRALCACRAFDLDLYLELGKALNFHASEPAFRQVLTRFSFVWSAPGEGEGGARYRVHDLLRRLMEERGEQQTRAAHQFLEAHYHKLAEEGDVTAMAEVFYHANRLAWQRGVFGWLAGFSSLLEHGQYDLCSVLTAVRPELTVEMAYGRARLAAAAADYFARLYRYEEARQEYLEAIRGYDETLRDSPNLVTVYGDKGHVWWSLGALQTQLSRHGEAAESFAEAIKACDVALGLDPEDAAFYHTKGEALSRLGELQARLSRHAEAVESFIGAVASYDAALRLKPEQLGTYSNKGWTLQQLGDSQKALSHHLDAVESYAAAVAAHDEALRRDPESVAAYNNKGFALTSLGELQSSLGLYDEAFETFNSALAAFHEVLTRAPEYVSAYNNMGLAYVRFGEMMVTLARTADARTCFTSAVAACEVALRLAPEYVEALNNTGLALQKLGELQAESGEHEEALDSYRKAVEALDRALLHAPELVITLNNKGAALDRLADLQHGLSRLDEAVESYGRSLAAYDEALRIAPEYVSAHNSKGFTLRKIGDLHVSQGRFDGAAESYGAAAAAHGEVLRRAPGHANALVNQGIALSRLAEMQAVGAAYGDANATYRRALDAFDEAIHLGPNNVYARSSLGMVLQRLGELQLTRGRRAEACHNLRAALAEFTHALAMAPGDEFLRRLGEALRKVIAEACESERRTETGE